MAALGAIATAITAFAGAGKGAELTGAVVNVLTDGGGKKALEWVETRLRAYSGGIPPNHELEHALRLAELTTSLVMVETYRREEAAEQAILRSAQEPPFIAAARSWLHNQIGLSLDLTLRPNAALIEALEHELDRVLAEKDTTALRATLAGVEQQVWDDLAAAALKKSGSAPPDDFRELFFGRSAAGKPGSSVVLQAFVRESLKDHPRVQVAFITSRLAALRTIAARLEANIEVLIAGQERTTATLSRMEARLAAIEAQTGTPRAVLSRVLEGFGELAAEMDADQLGQRLRAKAGEYHELRERLARLTNDDPRLQALRQKAGTLIDAGDFAAADAALAEAERLDLAVVEELESLTQRRRASAAVTRAERAAAARLRLDYRAEAEHYAAAAEIVAHDRTASWGYRMRRASALDDHGREFGDNRALNEAIADYHACLALAPRAERPADWATTQNDLGTALATLGERESGTTRLEQAVTAFRNAHNERTRERLPLDWAMTQNNLGGALVRLGERESGTTSLEQAVTAYSDSLKEITRERSPLHWAGTQSNLGNALQRLGERERGTARLEEAVTAYRDALTERTRERVPLDWAMTQNNLGTALMRLGERESGTAHLEEAVTAYRDALKERTRARVPLEWAMTQNNLGAALRALGERESGTARLEQAVTAYSDALKERTRERVPLQWATTQSNLGDALAALGHRDSGTSWLEEALAAWTACLTVAASVWPPEWVEHLRAKIAATRAEVARRKRE